MYYPNNEYLLRKLQLESGHQFEFPQHEFLKKGGTDVHESNIPWIRDKKRGHNIQKAVPP